MRCGRGILREEGLRTTSLGMLARGIWAIGGVERNGGGGGGGKPESLGIVGAAVFGAAANPGSMPAARSLSRRELGSAAGVDTGAGVGAC